MQTDPVITLASELRLADRAFDKALLERNAPKAAALGARLAALTSTLHSHTPTTPQGAAILLREAASALQDCENPAARKLARTINPIAAKLARGKPARADVISLRAAQRVAMGARQYGEEMHIVPDLIARALRGAAAPVLVSGADDRAPAPRARSRANLYLVQ